MSSLSSIYSCWSSFTENHQRKKKNMQNVITRTSDNSNLIETVYWYCKYRGWIRQSNIVLTSLRGHINFVIYFFVPKDESILFFFGGGGDMPRLPWLLGHVPLLLSPCFGPTFIAKHAVQFFYKLRHTKIRTIKSLKIFHCPPLNKSDVGIQLLAHFESSKIMKWYISSTEWTFFARGGHLDFHEHY